MEIKKLEYDDVKKEQIKVKELLRNLSENTSEDLTIKLLRFLEEKLATCFGAYDDSGLVGILWGYERQFSGELRFHINYFVVDEKVRGFGCGTKLLDVLYDYLQKKGIGFVDLNVDVENLAAREFYSKQKFNEEKILLVRKLGG